MKRLVLAFAAVAITSVTATASAQLWLRDRQATQGPGIRAGDVEWHPGVAAELGYDSNYFNRAPNGRSAGYPIVDTVRLRITPQISVSTLTAARKPDGSVAPPPSVSFNAGVAFIYSEFLTNADRLGRNREFGITGDLGLAISPNRPWGFNVFDNFTRTAQPSLDPDVTTGLNRIENRLAGELVYTKPGGLFDWRWGYGLGITYFETGPAQELNNIRHEVYTKGRWRFLPRTALVYDGSVWFIRYNNRPSTPSEGLSDSTPIRTRAGLSGLLTDRLSLLMMVGWGGSFYKNAGTGVRDFDSVIGQLEFRYFLTGAAPEAGTPAPAMSSFAIGFTRDFFNSYLGNFYERNRGYIQLSALIGQRFFLALDAGGAAVRYADILDRATGARRVSSFTNGRIDAGLFAEYRVKDWLGFNATFQYLAELSNVRIPASASASGGANNIFFAMEYNRFQAMGGVRAFF